MAMASSASLVRKNRNTTSWRAPSAAAGANCVRYGVKRS